VVDLEDRIKSHVLDLNLVVNVFGHLDLLLMSVY
jgi:hypothetical protein